MILSQIPDAAVTGRFGRLSSFEVKINDKLIFSKLDIGSFPKFENVVEQCINVQKGKQAEKVKETSFCIIS
jgi:hypothetical protein